MADSSSQLVECPLCETTFNPSVAGGWCTNTECGEWQYEETATGDGENGGGQDDPLAAVSAEADEEVAEERETEESTNDQSDAETDGAAEVEQLMAELAEESEPLEEEVADSGVDADVEAEDSAAIDEETDPESWFDELEATPVEEEADESVSDEADSEESDVEAESETGEDFAGEIDEEEGHEEELPEVSDEEAADVSEEETPDASEEEVADVPEEEPVEVSEEEKADTSEETVAGVTEEEQPDTSDEVESPAEDGARAPEVEDVDEAPKAEACPECGTENDADANFCKGCGADISAEESEPEPLTNCPDCGSDVDEDANFCSSCGYDLEAHRTGAGSAPTAPQTLVLNVRGRELAVVDGDTVGRELRRILTETGSDEDEALRIHREHVRFVREDDQFYLVDLGRNPTTLNGESMEKGDRKPVGPGDELTLSGVANLTLSAPQ